MMSLVSEQYFAGIESTLKIAAYSLSDLTSPPAMKALLNYRRADLLRNAQSTARSFGELIRS